MRLPFSCRAMEANNLLRKAASWVLGAAMACSISQRDLVLGFSDFTVRMLMRLPVDSNSVDLRIHSSIHRDLRKAVDTELLVRSSTLDDCQKGQAQPIELIMDRRVRCRVARTIGETSGPIARP